MWWRTGTELWSNRPLPVEPEECRRKPCAAGSRGHRTSPTPSGNGRRDSSKTKIHTIANRLAGEWSRRLGDEAAGTGDDETSIGSVTGTGHLKGPCDSYSQGPFAYFRH